MFGDGDQKKIGKVAVKLTTNNSYLISLS